MVAESVHPSEVGRGDIVRFIPKGAKKKVTIRVSDPSSYGSFMGHRARIEKDPQGGEPTRVTRGRENVYRHPDAVERLFHDRRKD